MGVSNLIKALQNTLQGGGRPHTANASLTLPRHLAATWKYLEKASVPSVTVITPLPERA